MKGIGYFLPRYHDNQYRRRRDHGPNLVRYKPRWDVPVSHTYDTYIYMYDRCGFLTHLVSGDQMSLPILRGNRRNSVSWRGRDIWYPPTTVRTHLFCFDYIHQLLYSYSSVPRALHITLLQNITNLVTKCSPWTNSSNTSISIHFINSFRESFIIHLI